MNLAVLLYSFLLRFSRYGPADYIFFGLISLIFLTLPEQPHVKGAVTSFLCSPPLIMFVAYIGASDGTYKKKSLDDGEYMALLFCRPISRASYIVTKWIAAALTVLWFVCLNLVLFWVMRMLRGHFELELMTGYEVANLLVNAFSFSAMMIFVRCLPLKIAIWLFAGLFYLSTFISAGVGHSGSFNASKDSFEIFYHIGDAISVVIQQFVFPFIDIETALTTTRFSYLPFITYISNISIYLFLATLILCRREFSYSFD